MRNFTTDSLLRWTTQWEQALNSGYPFGYGHRAGRLFWDLVKTITAAILELRRRGIHYGATHDVVKRWVAM